MILRRDGLMTSVNILRLYLPNYCYERLEIYRCAIVKHNTDAPAENAPRVLHAYLLDGLLLGVVQLVHVVVYLIKARVLIEVRPKIVHCRQLAHGLAYPCYNKMPQNIVWDSVESDTVIYRIQYQLRCVHKHRVDVGERPLSLFHFLILDSVASKVDYLLACIGVNPFASPHTENVCFLFCRHDTEVLYLLEAMPLVNHYHANGSRPVSLLTYKHGTKVVKITLASPKSPNKNLQVAENQYANVKISEISWRFPKSGK